MTAKPGEPAYELARAIFMAEYKTTAKSFDRFRAYLRRARVEQAERIIEALEKRGFVVTPTGVCEQCRDDDDE